jgi:hypothetical protein
MIWESLNWERMLDPRSSILVSRYSVLGTRLTSLVSRFDS